MFVGSLGAVYAVLSRFWVPGFILIFIGLIGYRFIKQLTKKDGTYILEWGCLLVCVSYAWQSLNQILWGVLVDGELDIGIGMVRYLLIIMPVLFIQVVLFIRQNLHWRDIPVQERLRSYVLGGGIIAAFYSSIAAYKLADVSTLTNCMYIAPADYHFGEFNDWARGLCR